MFTPSPRFSVKCTGSVVLLVQLRTFIQTADAGLISQPDQRFHTRGLQKLRQPVARARRLADSRDVTALLWRCIPLVVQLFTW